MGTHGKSKKKATSSSSTRRKRRSNESESDSYSDGSDSQVTPPQRSSGKRSERSSRSKSSHRSRSHHTRSRSKSRDRDDSDETGSSDNSDRGRKKKRSSRHITVKEVVEYSTKKAQKKAVKVAKKLKTHTVSGYSNDSNPFGDANLNERFVWNKKIERDVSQGAQLDTFSVKAEKKRRRESMV